MYSVLIAVPKTISMTGLLELLGKEYTEDTVRISIDKLAKVRLFNLKKHRTALVLFNGKEPKHDPDFLDTLSAVSRTEAKPLIQKFLESRFVVKRNKLSSDTRNLAAFANKPLPVKPKKVLEKINDDCQNYPGVCAAILRTVFGKKYTQPALAMKRKLEEATSKEKSLINLVSRVFHWLIKNGKEDVVLETKRIEDKAAKKKPKKVKPKMVTTNAKISPELRQIIDYWNTKENLRSCTNLRTKYVAKAERYWKAVKAGKFYDYTQKLSVSEIIDSIDKFELQATDPNVKPLSERTKELFRKFSIADFFYYERSGRSQLYEIVERGVETKVQPFSEIVLASVAAAVERIRGDKVTWNKMNMLATFVNKVKAFFDNNRRKIDVGVTVTQICKEVIHHLENVNDDRLYPTLMSEEMTKNILPSVCMESGIILATRRSSEQILTYRAVV